MADRGKEREEGVMSWVFGCQHTSCDGRGEHSKREKLLLLFLTPECVSRAGWARRLWPPQYQVASSPLSLPSELGAARSRQGARWPDPSLSIQLTMTLLRSQARRQLCERDREHHHTTSPAPVAAPAPFHSSRKLLETLL